MPLADPGAVADVSSGNPISTDWGNGIRDRVVHHFASAATRDAAITSPTEGMAAWLADTNTLTIYNGVAWRPLGWSHPWGVVARITPVVLDQGSITAVVDVTGSALSWTAVANRLYRHHVFAGLQSNGAAERFRLDVFTSANVLVKLFQLQIAVASQLASCSYDFVESGLSAGTINRKLRALCSVNTGTIRSSVAGCALDYWVEDIGPSVNTPA